MHFPETLQYTKSHEWIRTLSDGKVEIGLTDYAQKALGDLVFVNLPQVGDLVEPGVSFADVESVKAVSDVYSPVAGTVYEANEELMDCPQKINEAPYDAWLIRVEKAADFEELLCATQYAQVIASEEA
ncbi:MAG: glycine cleavage system protein GcvH [Clostridia bacterium]